MPNFLGWNDDDTVFCNLCKWRKYCPLMEQMEFFFLQHLWEVHKKKVDKRISRDTGKVTEIPL